MQSAPRELHDPNRHGGPTTIVEVVPNVEFEESGDGFRMKTVLQPNGMSVNISFLDCQ